MAAVGVWLIEVLVGDGGEVVGDEDFFEEAPEDEMQAGGDFGGGDGARLGDLGEEGVGALDGSGDEVGEVEDAEEEVEERVGGVDLAAIDIDGVGEGLEGVKGDADGEDDLKGEGTDLDAEGGKEGVEVGGEEVEVFEEAEEEQVGDDGEDEPGFPVFEGLTGQDLSFHAAGTVIVDRGGEEKGEEEAPIPGAIEEATGGEEEAVLGLMAKAEVDQQDDGQEDEELKRIE